MMRNNQLQSYEEVEKNLFLFSRILIPEMPMKDTPKNKNIISPQSVNQMKENAN